MSIKSTEDLKPGTLYIVKNDIEGFGDFDLYTIAKKDSVLFYSGLKGEDSFLDMLTGEDVFLFGNELVSLEEV